MPRRARAAPGLSPVPVSTWNSRRDARSLRGSMRVYSGAAGAEGFPQRCAGGWDLTHPRGRHEWGLSAVKFLFQISGKGGPLRQLNFCHVSLFLLKGVITAIQLQ